MDDVPKDLNELYEEWQKFIIEWYPEINEVYCVPPILFSATNLEPCMEIGPGVFEAHENFEPKVRGDEAQRRTMTALQKFAKKKKLGMFILSEVKYESVLSKGGSNIAQRLLELDIKKIKQGDADILIIHLLGLLVIQIKAIDEELNPDRMKDKDRIKLIKRIPDADRLSKDDLNDKIRLELMKDPIEKAIEQLDKDEKNLNTIVEKLEQKPKIRKTIALPNISRKKLREILHQSPALKEKMNKCLMQCEKEMQKCDVENLCLTANDLPDKGWPISQGDPDISEQIENRLKIWWANMFEGSNETKNMATDMYRNIAARFIGPLSTVAVPTELYNRETSQVREVRTTSEALEETARRLSMLILLPEQLEILSSEDRRVHLTGPPGVGKTLCLLLKAVLWLKAGYSVCLVQTEFTDFLANRFKQQLVELLESKEDIVKRFGHVTAKNELTAKMDDLRKESKEKIVCLVVDECHTLDDSIFNVVQTDDYLWSASFSKLKQTNIFHPKMIVKPMRMGMRTTQKVMQHIRGARFLYGFEVYENAPQYPKFRPPTDGRDVEVFQHTTNQHSECEIIQCSACGDALAKFLTRELCVGKPTPSNQSDEPQLQWKDVLVLVHPDTQGTTADILETQFVCQLKAVKIPVTAAMMGKEFPNDNAVIVCPITLCAGLEKKIVVYISSSDDSQRGVSKSVDSYFRSTVSHLETNVRIEKVLPKGDKFYPLTQVSFCGYKYLALSRAISQAVEFQYIKS